MSLDGLKKRHAVREKVGTVQDRYSLYGGQRGYDRLLVLSNERRSDTDAFLERVGVAPGMNCIDLGCGGGEVTMRLAERTAPGGSAVGIDRDESILELAREAAKRRGIQNVRFKSAEVGQWSETAEYDLVYSRFVLQHLSRPDLALRQMWGAVRSGGILAVEDADHDGWALDPPNSGFEFFRRNLMDVIARSGGDPTLGRKLYRLFREAGIPDPQVGMIAPLRVTGEGKMMPWLTLQSISDSIVSAGLASQSEIQRALDLLEPVSKSPESVQCGPRIFQVFARKTQS